MEKIINLDPEVQRQDRIGRYFHTLKGIEEDALHKYELNNTAAEYRRSREKNAIGKHLSSQHHRALLKLNETELGKKLAWVAKERSKLLKER
jgi:hypothetical protein